MKSRVERCIREAAPDLVDISHSIHANPELGFEENFACELLSSFLDSKGFEVSRGVFDLSTAFLATTGQGGPIFVVCAEYDALPDIGHACGHNIIAAAAIGAGLGAGSVAHEAGFEVAVMGTPAEETIGAKAILVERGAFATCDAAMMVHPAPVDILDAPYLSVTDLDIECYGEAAHASIQLGARGANALDALVEVYAALNSLDLGPYERCNGVITDGGKAPNVVPERATASYYIRAKTRQELERLIERVRTTASEAATRMGCAVEFSTSGIVLDEVVSNQVILDLYRKNAESLGRRFFPEERLTPQMAGSTDMGNVSKVVPAIHPTIGIDSLPYLPHQRGFADKARSKAADRAIVDAAIAMAWTMIDLALNSSVLQAAKEAFGSATAL